MYFLLFLTVLAIVYIKSFKESFNQEQVQKVTPVLVVSTLIIFIFAIFASLISN